MSDQIAWKRSVSDVNEGVLVGIHKPARMYYAALALALICTGIGVYS